MTYCVGLKLDRGLVMAADTRTNAGVDNVASYKKLHTWEKPGDRVFILLTAGNLAVTQAVVNQLTEEAHHRHKKDAEPSLFTAATMFHAARSVGRVLNQVRERQSSAQPGLKAEAFYASFILGGQIGAEEPRLFNIYAEGNFIEAGPDTPYFQIGEHKYGKPILDRVIDPQMRLGEAAKIVLLSFDSTLRSNLSVGMPIDMVLYNRDTLKIERQVRIEQNDPYFMTLSTGWSNALRTAAGELPEFEG